MQVQAPPASTAPVQHRLAVPPKGRMPPGTQHLRPPVSQAMRLFGEAWQAVYAGVAHCAFAVQSQEPLSALQCGPGWQLFVQLLQAPPDTPQSVSWLPTRQTLAEQQPPLHTVRPDWAQLLVQLLPTVSQAWPGVLLFGSALVQSF